MIGLASLFGLKGLALLRRFWWAPIIAALAFTVAIQRGTIARKDAALERVTTTMSDNIARVEKATLTAKLAAATKARAIEAAQNKATQEISGEYQTQLRAAYALLAARRVRNDAQAYRGYLYGDAAAGAAQPASPASGASGMSLVGDDDLRICTTNTVKALSWLSWFKRIQAIPR